jgi:LPXTG-motif cell wall-anchored protein
MGKYTFTVRLADRSDGEGSTSITIIVGRDMTTLVYLIVALAALVVAGLAVWLWRRKKKSKYVPNFEI